MATRRGTGTKKSAGKSAPPRSSGGGRNVVGNVVLYSLALVGGIYLGTRGYAAVAEHLPGLVARIGGPAAVKPAAARRASAEPKPVAARREPRREPRRAADDEETPEVRVTEKNKEADIPDESSQVPEPATSEPTPGSEEAGEDRVIPVPPREIERGVGHRKEIALTFDAGSDWKPVKKILETLGSANYKSTFFLTGEWVQANPKSSRLITSEGHELGNHSWDHAQFTGLTADQIREQVRKTEAIIQETTGRGTRPYFRPPHGARNAQVLETLGKEGYFSIYWTLDSHDSVRKGITAEQIRDRVLSNAKAGSIVLLHCGSQPTADALPGILEGLRQRGLTPVTLTRLLEE